MNKELFEPIYRPIEHNGKAYAHNVRVPIVDSYIKFSKKDFIMHSEHITYGPGIYGIFVREPFFNCIRANDRDTDLKKLLAIKGYETDMTIDGRHTKGVRQCLYIGQSNNVKRRVFEHKENFKHAKRQLASRRIYRPRFKIQDLGNTRDVELKYYRMADLYMLGDLKFLKLVSIDCDYTETEITALEQLCIDVFKPQFNTIAARPTI